MNLEGLSLGDLFVYDLAGVVLEHNKRKHE